MKRTYLLTPVLLMLLGAPALAAKDAPAKAVAEAEAKAAVKAESQKEAKKPVKSAAETTAAKAAVKAAKDGGAFAGSYIGEVTHYKTAYEDTMVQIARKNDVGFVELRAANPAVDPWLPGKDVDMVIPTMHILPDAPHKGVVINLPEMRLFQFPSSGTPNSYPIGIGREGLLTPIGQTFVRAKKEGPTWRPTPRMRLDDPTLPELVPPGPDNPMGTHVLYLGWAEYGIHGTNKPYGIGRRSSSGCIRMYPEDIVRLYTAVPENAMVTVVNQPVKATWIEGRLYIEAHPTIAQADRMELEGGLPTYDMSDDDMKLIMKHAGVHASEIDWPLVRTVIRERKGYPIPVTDRVAGAGTGPTADGKAADSAPDGDVAKKDKSG